LEIIVEVGSRVAVSVITGVKVGVLVGVAVGGRGVAVAVGVGGKTTSVGVAVGALARKGRSKGTGIIDRATKPTMSTAAIPPSAPTIFQGILLARRSSPQYGHTANPDLISFLQRRHVLFSRRRSVPHSGQIVSLGETDAPHHRQCSIA
jgi:hypothetical protein